jgi:hypothetical protein
LSCHREDASVSHREPFLAYASTVCATCPIVDGGRVLGMISIGGLVEAVIAEKQQRIEQPES